MTYNNAGELLTIKDGVNNTTTLTYDGVGRPVKTVGPDLVRVRPGYDPAGNRTRFTDGRGNPFVTTYNAWGLPESQIEPATSSYSALADRTFTFGYDANGRVAQATAPGGVTVEHSYDEMGRLTQQIGTGAEATTGARNFGYDLAGRMTSLSGSGGTNLLTYDDRSLLTSVAGPSGGSTFGYNPDGALAGRQEAAGTTNYPYDGAGRLATTANPAAGVEMTYSYNSLSQVSSIAYGTGANHRDFGYDSLSTGDFPRLSGPTFATIGRS